MKSNQGMRRAVTISTVFMIVGVLVCPLPADGRDFRVNSKADIADTRPGDGICALASGTHRCNCSILSRSNGWVRRNQGVEAPPAAWLA